eukprot:3800780-Alexandrium_andersonii.AAC.1
MVNDLKRANVPPEVGQFFARIADPDTYAEYGQLTGQQAELMLLASESLGEAMASTYANHQPC